MSDPVARLNAALEGRYAIERELGALRRSTAGTRVVVVLNFFGELRQVVPE